MVSHTGNGRFAVCVPSSPLAAARYQLDRLFNDFFASAPTNTSVLGGPGGAAAWEEGEALHLEFELPGVRREDVEVTACQGKLTVTAERREPEGERQYWVNQRWQGRFERTWTLPETIDAEAVQAELKDGVLHLVLPKKAELQPKKVEVKIS